MKITRYIIGTILILAGIALFGLFIFGVYYKYIKPILNVPQALTLPDGTDAKVKNIINDVDGSIGYELLDHKLINTPAGKLKAERVRFSKNGKIKECYLSEPQVIETPTGKSKVKEVEFNESGKIRTCEFSDPQTIETPAGKFKVGSVSFYESGKIGGYGMCGEWGWRGCISTESLVIDTPAGKLKVKRADSIVFYESGNLYMCYRLSEPQAIETPAGKLKVKTVSFYESGKIRNCDLSESQIIDTPAGKLKVFGVYFSDSGKVCNLYLSEEKTINGKTYIKGTRIGWDPDMKFLGEMRYNCVKSEWVQRHVQTFPSPESDPAPDKKDDVKTAPPENIE